MPDKPTYSQLENRLTTVEQEVKELLALYRAATKIGANLSFRQTLDAIAVNIIDTIHANGCSISKWHPNKNHIETLTDHNKTYPEATDNIGQIYDLKDYPATLRALTSGQTLLIKIDDPTADMAEIALMRKHEIFTNLVVPLKAKDRVLGLLEIYEDLEPREYTLREIRLAESLAARAATALENAELYEKARAEQDLRRAQHISKIGSWYYDRKSETEIWSDECFRIYGINKDDYPGGVVPESLSSSMCSNPQEVEERSVSLAEKYDTYEIEFTTVPINGQMKSIHSYCDVERDDHGNILKIFGADHDITERKQAELKMLQAQKNAEAANRAKSDFLANMSHELRTPLNHIIGFTELVADENCGELNPMQKEYLTDAISGGRHLLSLINDILDLSKVEAGKEDLQLSEVDLKALLKNSMSMIKEETQKHQIRTEILVDGLPKTIVADERKLKQIVYNLLSNAVKFTPDNGAITLAGTVLAKSNEILQKTSGKTLAVPLSELYTNPEPNEYIEITVRDTGIGLAPKDLERIFDSFEQVESSKSRTYQGTGLGLALTKKYVGLHGGIIWAESQGEGQGSTFCFILPLVSNDNFKG